MERSESLRAVLDGVALLMVVLPTLSFLPWGEGKPSPWAEAERAEAQVPPLGLNWGKLRAVWPKGEGWDCLWQPSHGGWVVKVWVPSRGPVEPPRLELAPWLPGARLSKEAAEAWVRGEEAVGFREWPGRRDWLFPRHVLFGTVLAARESPALFRFPWLLAALAGFTAAGAVFRRTVPVAMSMRFRPVLLAAFGALALTGWSWSRVAFGFFVPGVRPWVGMLVMAAMATTVAILGLFGAYTLPVPRGRVTPVTLLAAFGLGLFWGGSAAREVEVLFALPVLPFWLLLLPLVGGYWLALAGDGLRLLLPLPPKVRLLLILALAGVVIWLRAPGHGLVLGALLAGAVEWGAGTPVAMAYLAGWLPRAVLAQATWPSALWQGGGALLVAAVGLFWALCALRRSNGRA